MTDIYPTLEDTCTHILELFLPRDWYSNIYYGSEQAEMVYQNWMHAHSLDETAINYDGISIVRLVALLRLGASGNPEVASMPDGPADLKSDKFKAFLKEFADAITPAGYLSSGYSCPVFLYILPGL